jgi:Flp pilus assembly protein TadG
MSTKAIRCQKGQAVVELTFSFLLFMAMFFALVEFSHLLYTRLTLQHALRGAGRYMVTGKTTQDALGNDLPRPEVVRTIFCTNVIATGLACPNLGPDFVFACVSEACTEPGGGPEQTVTVTVQLSKPAMTPFFSQFFPSGGVPFQLSTTWRNEPFPQT